MSTTKRFIIVWLVWGWAAVLAAAQTDTPAFPIGPDIPVEGNINDSNPLDRYTIDVPAGATLVASLSATSGDLDPLLVVLDPDGGLFQNDDRAQGERNAELRLEALNGGTYTLEATRFRQEDGNTSGTYRLMLTFEGVASEDGPTDPLLAAPPYSVDYTQLDYGTFGAGELSAEATQAYFVVGGESGDLLRANLIPTGEGDLSAGVTIITPTLETISQTLRPRADELLAYATLPEREWYLIEVTRVSGAGSFSLFVDATEGQVIRYNTDEAFGGSFTPAAPSVSYVINGNLGDQLFVSASVQDEGAAPQVRLLDVRQRELGSASGERIALLQAALPRTGTYIIQVNNLNPQIPGNYNLRLSANVSDPSKLDTTAASYNTAYKGDITADDPRDIYAFDGKVGELITVEMRASKGSLDPFVAIMDSELNELTTNDNFRGTADARINQFTLPADGTYYVLAGRADLAFGESVGTYTLALNAGSISLVEGDLTATLTWNSDSDLNLFVREPSGRIVSWSNPVLRGAGALQVDSNTNCETLSGQPVEHVYWEDFPANGDYELWVWHQEVCGQQEATTFTFELARLAGGLREIVHRHEGELAPNERYEIDIRVSAPEVFLLGDGEVTQPSPQQRASEGGDIPLLYGQKATGSISDTIYARFYQFEGTEGDTIAIDLETVTGDLDPMLILRDDNERNVVPPVDDISDTNRNARLQTTLPASGRYVIAVTRFGVRDGLTTGDYALTLQRGTP